MIVLHYTAGGTAMGAINHFVPSTFGKPSAHYVIERNGKIYQVVDDADTAFHAGIGNNLIRDSVIKPNPRSIGIEIVNWGSFANLGGVFYTYPDPENQNATSSRSSPYYGTDVTTVTPPWTPHGTLTAYSYWQTFTDAQYSSLRALINSLSVKYGITRVAYSPSPILYEPNVNTLANFIGLLGHSVLNGIIGGGKWDPGPVLNWNSVLGN